MLGVKFRRQHPIGPYIVDFACLECRLIIEVDGGQHQEQAEAARRRDQELSSQGFLVLRFWNGEVLRMTSDVLEKIWTAAQTRRPSPLTPLPLRGRGEFDRIKRLPTKGGR